MSDFARERVFDLGRGASEFALVRVEDGRSSFVASNGLIFVLVRSVSMIRLSC